MEQQSIVGQFNDLMVNDDEELFINSIYECLSLDKTDTKTKTKGGRGLQVFSLKKGIISNKDKGGLIYALMKSLFYWFHMFNTLNNYDEKYFKSRKDYPCIPKSQHDRRIDDLQGRIEELDDMVSGRDVISLKEHEQYLQLKDDEIRLLEKKLYQTQQDWDASEKLFRNNVKKIEERSEKEVSYYKGILEELKKTS
tara:strand:- start:1763 stop:2350 length:588 start_codon:yes stop_codon:yes gene_type:complete